MRKPKSIVLRAHEVRGVLEGRVSLLHRPIKPQPFFVVGGHEQARATIENREPVADSLRWICGGVGQRTPEEIAQYCPFGSPGGLLIGRETWAENPEWDTGIQPLADVPKVVYKADFPTGSPDGTHDTLEPWGTWKSSVTMPRWASRITLEIKEVRVYRLQELSIRDARAAGTPTEPRQMSLFGANAEQARRIWAIHFGFLWESIHGPESWRSNPWVWALTVSPKEQGEGGSDAN